MAEYFPFLTVAIAMLASVFKLPKLQNIRWTLALFSIGTGQIYLATIFFLFFLLMENGWKISKGVSQSVLIFTGLLFLFTLAITAHSGVDFRKLSEILQLVLYVVIYLALVSYLDSDARIKQFLLNCSMSAFAVTFFSFLALLSNLKNAPDVFIGRGPNEGSEFIVLIGVLSAAYAFSLKRKVIYAFMCLPHIFLISLATSRGSLLICGLIAATVVFFLIRNKIVRSVIIAGCIYTLAISIPQLQDLGDNQMNFSTRERILLAQGGWDIAQEKFWMGWGWGSTNLLAQQVPTIIPYPHFHNTYIQLLVELGFFGWTVIFLFLYFVCSRCYIAFVEIRRGPISTLVVSSSLSLIVVGFFDAMLFGADRALQVVILMALLTQSVKVGKIVGHTVSVQDSLTAAFNGRLRSRTLPT